ncbi:MAG TPA: transcriptional regulator MntR, partial [Paenibacillaceae bacterium]|nr:transcriptional regulator MntR [Paenibacillaceae bacterium]
EKYRGLVLTTEGKKMGKRLVDRHSLLESFLRTIGVPEDKIYKDVEGIEHHLSVDSLTCIDNLLKFFAQNPEMAIELKKMLETNPD